MEFSNDPILAGIAEQLQLLGIKPNELQRDVVEGQLTVTFWAQAQKNMVGRFDSSAIFQLITPVRDHFLEVGGQVDFSIDYVLGRVSFRLSA